MQLILLFSNQIWTWKLILIFPLQEGCICWLFVPLIIHKLILTEQFQLHNNNSTITMVQWQLFNCKFVNETIVELGAWTNDILKLCKGNMLNCEMFNHQIVQLVNCSNMNCSVGIWGMIKLVNNFLMNCEFVQLFCTSC